MDKTPTAADFNSLQSRLANLRERRAVLVSKEDEKERQRTALLEKLKEAGVDTDNLPQERIRLAQEAAEAFRAAAEAVDSFERAIQDAENGASALEPLPSGPIQATVAPEPAEPGDDDIDLDIS